MGNIEMNGSSGTVALKIRKYIQTVWERRLLVELCVVIGLFTGFIISFAILPPKYKSSAIVAEMMEGKEHIGISNEGTNREKIAKELAHSEQVRRGAVQLLKYWNITADEQTLEKSLIVMRDKKPGSFRITFEGENSRAIMYYANAYAESFINIANSDKVLNGNAREIHGHGNRYIITSKAVEATTPVWPDRPKIYISFALIGLAAGLVLSPRIKPVNDSDK